MKIDELFETKIKKAETIASATMRNGEINRAAANRIVDPKGYFKSKIPKNPSKTF